MNMRFLLVTILVLFVGSSLAEARTRSGNRKPIGDHATEPLARVPKKRTAAPPATRIRTQRGMYPFVGKRKTPKRTY